MAKFNPESGSGGFPFCLKDSLNNNNRDKLVRCLAEFRIVPVKNSWEKTDLGKNVAEFERRGNIKPGGNHVAGTNTQGSMLSVLGVEETSDIEQVREEIKSHPRWGAKA